ncbi:MAG: peptide deformylase [Candidatus Omnitrophica bacterium]|nr:peptide deformylase [Candidatus Omnitrophota bacterium]
MAVLKLTTFPDKILKVKTREVLRVTEEERRLAKDMIETMYAERGVGLAANQVGVSKQLFVASADQVRGKEMVFLNPRIIRKQGTVKEFEGCLSVPECYEPVKRSKRVWMRAMTLEGKEVEVKADGLLARIFQHEIDHLNGFLFIDRLGLIKSRLTRRALLKRAARPRA